MRNRPYQDREKSEPVALRDAARDALRRLLEPLADFALDFGLSVNEVNAVFRETAIRSAAAKQRKVSKRINASGIAASTGVPRAEVAKLLNAEAATLEVGRKELYARQSPVTRILAAWVTDPVFSGPKGQAADLRVYGIGLSLEALAKKYARGIPVRALLDELIRSGTVELLETNRTRVMVRMTMDRRISVHALKSFGASAAKFLATSLQKMSQPGAQMITADASSKSTVLRSLKLFRQDFAKIDSDLVREMQGALSNKSGAASRNGDGLGTIGASVTIYCQDRVYGKNEKTTAAIKRRNLKRVGR